MRFVGKWGGPRSDLAAVGRRLFGGPGATRVGRTQSAPANAGTGGAAHRTQGEAATVGGAGSGLGVRAWASVARDTLVGEKRRRRPLAGGYRNVVSDAKSAASPNFLLVGRPARSPAVRCRVEWVVSNFVAPRRHARGPDFPVRSLGLCTGGVPNRTRIETEVFSWEMTTYANGAAGTMKQRPPPEE